MNGTHKQIFIVITQTGTMLSRILKRITGGINKFELNDNKNII